MTKGTASVISGALNSQMGPQFPKKPPRWSAPPPSAFLLNSLPQSRSFDQRTPIYKCSLILSSHRHPYLMNQDATLTATKRRHSKLIIQFRPQKYLIGSQMQNYKEFGHQRDQTICPALPACVLHIYSVIGFLKIDCSFCGLQSTKSPNYIKWGCFVFCH